MAIPIILNGEPYPAADGQTILELLATLSLDPERVAVEMNRRIVKQPFWAETRLEPGARIEIVQFVGGG